ncbi:MAG TPA: GvpL/GvpF family gas vesicle protein [Candidatus Brocadiia bacterium]|nr:GvpL/GvpF family gas vesicle protein [Candidatus Brocadiales bacterium]
MCESRVESQESGVIRESKESESQRVRESESPASPTPDSLTRRLADSRLKTLMEGYYFYGVIETNKELDFGSPGIGGRNDKVFTVNCDSLAAVVSKTPLVVYDPVRENCLAHNRIIEEVIKDHAMIPASFGTIFRTEMDIKELLKDNTEKLKEVMKNLGNRKELSVKALWKKDALKDLLNRYSELRQLKQEIEKRPPEKSHQLRFRLGSMVEQVKVSEGNILLKDIYEHLKKHSAASRINDPIGDRMIMNASFLVDRDKEKEFQAELDKLEEKYREKVMWIFTGDWAPYNFVKVRMEVLHGQRRCKKERVYV